MTPGAGPVWHCITPASSQHSVSKLELNHRNNTGRSGIRQFTQCRSITLSMCAVHRIFPVKGNGSSGRLVDIPVRQQCHFASIGTSGYRMMCSRLNAVVWIMM
ncbi:hypothetical protein TNCV_4286971 [Trichonephila clavipes]|nr:hypothetical protein TNCV_4286971 [Trichonephila clavipes]